MSNVEEELEEGEITDSDSETGIQEQPDHAKPPVSEHSIFRDLPTSTEFRNSVPGLQQCDSESDNSNSGNEDDYENDEDSVTNVQQKRKFRVNKDCYRSEPFVNPHFVINGGFMPPVPKQTSKSIWGSVLQEQILTADVGNFSMEKTVFKDRDVESYDYTRAKEDDRPFLEEDEVNSKEDELFGEVIDLEQSALKQQRTLKRKHVGNRIGKRQGVKERLDLPLVTNSSLEEVTYYISTKLQESKVHLIRRVVWTLGQAKSLALLKKTEEIEASGGMMIMNGSRRRTPGGVYLMLLKTDSDVSQEQVDTIFKEENKWSLEIKKRKRARARRRKRECDEQKTREASAESKGENSGVMEVTEEGHSRSSVEGQTGSPKNHADHLSDTQNLLSDGEIGVKDELSDNGDISDSDKSSEREVEDFETQLARELQRQAKGREVQVAKEADISTDAVTVDDILDIGVDEDFID